MSGRRSAAAADDKENDVLQRLKRNNVLGVFKAKYEAEIFHSLPREHAAKAIPNMLAQEFHNCRDGQVVAGLVRDVLQALGLESTLRVFEPESAIPRSKGLERVNLRQALSLKGAQPAASTPLLVALLQQHAQERAAAQQHQQHQQQHLQLQQPSSRSSASISHEYSADDDAMDDGHDPLRSLPSEQQLQSSFREESMEFDELDAELAKTSDKHPSPLMLSALKSRSTPPPPPPEVSFRMQSPSPDFKPVASLASTTTLAPVSSLAPQRQPHLSSLGDLPDFAQPKRTLDPLDAVSFGSGPRTRSSGGEPSASNRNKFGVEGASAMDRDLEDLEAEIEALRPVSETTSSKASSAAAPQVTQKPTPGLLTSTANALAQQSSSLSASSSLVDSLSRGAGSNKGTGLSGAKAALPPSALLADDQPGGSKSRVQGNAVGPGRRAGPGGAGSVPEPATSAPRQSALDGSYELDGDSGDDGFEELDESVEDLEESDREIEVENVVEVAGNRSEEEEVEIDYDDLGDVTPPESVAADEMEFELEGASLDDDDFQLDTEDVF
eukprot:CAMPEP_0197615978 /NCGR_PEP_ID=MMETSP1326-20131121/60298_1 /TAXON_ID=1155430 /ORGANISM="Genus nov. species nov., Strain RCC2288" /LENGTH=553 /DNA_ID=CAMNT_0043184859 /DNA_START=74 /DNA_END=1735 /DNA_ORIENTATION=-